MCANHQPFYSISFFEKQVFVGYAFDCSAQKSRIRYNDAMKHIRNFSIIAHVDHGKSTLADRILEITGAITEREMKNQILDSMDLERERGITIKMQPVCITHTHKGQEYVLNLIDTPGHIDFSYEVSRSLRAVEGVLLLVDATQGIQAQTLSVLRMAQDIGLTVIPVLSKVDVPHARIDDITLAMVDLLGCGVDDVRHTSGKTGAGVKELLDTIIEKIPAPKESTQTNAQALVFDFGYSTHNGVTAFARIFSGTFKKGDSLKLLGANKSFVLKELGVCAPKHKPLESLGEGMIGYFVSGIKEAGVPFVGDTPCKAK